MKKTAALSGPSIAKVRSEGWLPDSISALQFSSGLPVIGRESEIITGVLVDSDIAGIAISGFPSKSKSAITGCAVG